MRVYSNTKHGSLRLLSSVQEHSLCSSTFKRVSGFRIKQRTQQRLGRSRYDNISFGLRLQFLSQCFLSQSARIGYKKYQTLFCFIIGLKHGVYPVFLETLPFGGYRDQLEYLCQTLSLINNSVYFILGSQQSFMGVSEFLFVISLLQLDLKIIYI